MKFKDFRLAGLLTIFGFFVIYVFDYFKINEINPFVLFIVYYLLALGIIKFDKFVFKK
jgi:hypothetical protein